MFIEKDSGNLRKQAAAVFFVVLYSHKMQIENK